MSPPPPTAPLESAEDGGGGEEEEEEEKRRTDETGSSALGLSLRWRAMASGFRVFSGRQIEDMLVADTDTKDMSDRVNKFGCRPCRMEPQMQEQ